MSLDFPFGEFIQAQQLKNQNQQNMYQNINNMGQSLGQMGQVIGEAVKQQKQKALMSQLVAAMNGQGQPQQGPPMFGSSPTPGGSLSIPSGQPMTAGTANIGQDVAMGPPQPTSGMGAPAQDNTKMIQSLMMQLNPEMGIKAQFDRMDPYKQALSNQANAEAEKMLRPPIPKVPLEWIDTGRTTTDGKAIYVNKATGEEMVGKTAGTPKPTFGSGMAGERHAQFEVTQMPSNQSATTAGGAAYQVKVASRQGKSIIAKATTPQAVALASADLGRAVQRSAVLAETIGAANFANNLTTKWNLLNQKVTADPKSKDIPKLRKEMFDMFTELDNAASPWITNQLNLLKRHGYDITPEDYDEQMARNIPEIKFDAGLGAGNSGNPSVTNFSVR